jgi:flavin reductase (DIM6/NTAB) family NADH-FMN oxidoreductase RutF
MTSPEVIALEGEVLRRAFSCFPSGVTAVCGLVDGEPVGMAASSFTSVSLDPPLVLVCVANESATWERLRTVGRLGVSILSADHHVVCRQLAARQGDRFAGVQWTLTDSGALILDGASAWLDCEIHEEVPAGDHLVVLLRIHALEADPAVAPLVFHSSGFRQLAEAVADNP